MLRRCVWSRNVKNSCSIYIYIYIYDISSLRVKSKTINASGGTEACLDWSLPRNWRREQKQNSEQTPQLIVQDGPNSSYPVKFHHDKSFSTHPSFACGFRNIHFAPSISKNAKTRHSVLVTVNIRNTCWEEIRLQNRFLSPGPFLTIRLCRNKVEAEVQLQPSVSQRFLLADPFRLRKITTDSYVLDLVDTECPGERNTKLDLTFMKPCNVI